MADQVTISTFLELRDNLSEGMKKVAAVVEATTSRVRKARSDEDKAAERSATAQIKSMKAVDAMLKEQERAREKTQKDLLRSSTARAKKQSSEEAKLANLQWRDAERLIVQQERLAAKKSADTARQIKEATRLFNAQWRDAERLIVQQERLAARKVAADAKAAERSRRLIAREVTERARWEERAMREKLRNAQKTADAEIRQAEKVRREKERLLRSSITATQQPATESLLSTLLKAEFLAAGIRKTFDLAKDAVVGMFRTAIHYGIEYEKVNTDIASALFTTRMAPSMEVGKAAAQDLMKTMHDISLKLPGQAQDYYYVFAQALPAAISVGMHDMNKFSRFISEYTAVAIKRNVSSQRAATDMQMMLQGRARITTNMFQKLLPYINMTHLEFNKLMKTDRAKGIELLIKAVSQSASGMKGVAADALTTFGELQTRLTDIAIWGEKPIFQATKNAVIDLNLWLEKNTETVNNLAGTVSNVLGDAFQGVVLTVIDIADGLKEILGLTSDKKGKRTLPDIQKELAEAKDTVFKGPLGTLASPLMATIKKGTVARLEKEYETTKKHEEQLRAMREQFKWFEEMYAPELSIEKQGPKKIADMLAPYYKQNVFEVEGKKPSEAFAEYLESRGLEKLDINKIWIEMLKMGAETPLSLPHHDDLSAHDIAEPVKTPSDRTRTYNDFRNSRFDIKQEFAEGFDPDRIAVSFASDLARLGDMKLQASYGLAGGVR